MERMVRKQTYIKPRQAELLKRRARELGVSEAELIRQGVDEVVGSVEALTTAWQVWEEEKAFIEQRRRMAVPQTGRGWTRDELYEDRLERFSR